jgi:hypothetical protein
MQERTRFIFAISFIPRAVCSNWERAQANLRRTIKSIRGMSRKDYRIVVACHEFPDLADLHGSDLELLLAPFPIETDLMRRGADKIRKRRLIGSWLRERLGEDGAYVMFLDADDLVHRDLVDHILRDDNRRSYIAEAGYIFDATTGLLEQRRARFYTTCGSCFVCWFGRDDLPLSFEDADCLYSQFDLHREFKEMAARLGRPSEPFPFPAVVYLANHEESLRVKQFVRMREVDLFKLVWPRKATQVLEQDFSCADVAGTVARPWPFISGVALSSIRQLWHRGMRYALPGRNGLGQRGDPAEVIKEIRSAPERVPQADASINGSRRAAAKRSDRLTSEKQTKLRTSLET